MAVILLAPLLGLADPSHALMAADPRPLPRFERVVIDEDFPGGYQVEVADVNGDGKPDIIGVGGGTCAWYENPSWRKRIVTTPKQTPEIISSATADLDGDGKAEIAIAYEFSMNEPTRGKLLVASQGKDLDSPWKLASVADLGSIHRLRWSDVDGDKRLDLVVAPLFGPKARGPSFQEDPARLVVFRTGTKPKEGDWKSAPIGERPVLHAIEVLDVDGDGLSEVLTADNLGVGLFRFRRADVSGKWVGLSLTTGAVGEAPKCGSSEVHLGRLADRTRFLATIDPWHGNEVSVCRSDAPKSLAFGPRTVIDSTLAEGHALWVADVDGDGDDEIFAGHRGKDARVSAYDFDGKTWNRTVLDPGMTAQDLRGGDLDGDGAPDVVAIAGQSHRIVWYRPLREGRPRVP